MRRALSRPSIAAMSPVRSHEEPRRAHRAARPPHHPRDRRVALAVFAALACLVIAAPAAAHDASIDDGAEPSKCKAPCPDIKSAAAGHMSKKMVFQIRTKRAFSTKSSLAPRVQVKVGATPYLLTAKGGSSSKGKKFAVKVTRESAKSIRYSVSAAKLGSPDDWNWRARIDKKGKSVDRAPNKGFVGHGKAAPPAAQSRTKLTATGARDATITDDGGCTSYKDSSGDEPGRDWGGAWSSYSNGGVWIVEVDLQRSEYKGPGTYAFPGRTSADGPPSLSSDNWARFGNGALTAWETLHTPAAVAGSVTVNPDQRSGTLDATLVKKDDGTQVKLGGSFHCDALSTG